MAGDNLQRVFERDLSEREREILQRIVHLYILKASPIGSRFLSKYMEEIRLSPATLRNVMADLEDLDYISHPHTSAGRIPTDKGYRFYVDTLNSSDQLSDKEILALYDQLNTNSDAILKNASKLLGALSKYLAVVRIPALKEFLVEKIELLPLSSNKLLVVLALDSSIVKTITIEANYDIDQKLIEPLTRYINDKVSGKPLRFIRDNFLNIMNDFENSETPLIRLFVDSIDKLFSSQTQDKVFISGAQNLFDHPEFEDIHRIKGIVELIENEDIIIHLLNNGDEREGIKVLIGREMENDLLDEYSLVKASYSIGSASGSIGLIGPKRMNYAKMIAIVQNVSELLSKNIN